MKRKSIEKIYKEAADLNNTTDQMELTDIHNEAKGITLLI